MRLFVAIDFPNSIKDKLQTLQTSIPDANCTNPQQFHLTLSYIGETDQIDVVKNALAEVESPAFELQLMGTGRFPIQTKPKSQVLYARVEAQSALTDLHQKIATVLSGNGFAVDSRPFLPHITLAYIDIHDFLPISKQFTETNQSFQTDPFTVSEFILYSSDIKSEEVRHRREAVFALSSS